VDQTPVSLDIIRHFPLPAVDRQARIGYSSLGTLLIGLISDTHIATADEKLPAQIKTVFDGVDLILHAGDIWVSSALDELEEIAPVKAAWGDDDIEADLGGDDRMLEEHTLSLAGKTVWLSHIKPPYGHIVPRESMFASRRTIEEPPDPPDVVVFGHIHAPVIEHYKGVLIVNPGSATWPEYLPALGTVALLTIGSGGVEANIIQLE
jgi:putative phosphoesterase